MSGDLIPRTDRRRVLYEYVYGILNTPFTTIEIFYASAYIAGAYYIYIRSTMFALPSDRAISPFRNDFDLPPLHGSSPTTTLYVYVGTQNNVDECRNDDRTRRHASRITKSKYALV